jgi:hypothetical protein
VQFHPPRSEVVDSEKLSYRQKKGSDREVSINGAKSKVEMNYDQLPSSQVISV